jgi:predicted kinase
LLQQRFTNLRGVDVIADALRDKPANRLEAAQAALGDFEATGVELTGLCKKVKRALQMLNP